jgi:hypothetical protein
MAVDGDRPSAEGCPGRAGDRQGTGALADRSGDPLAQVRNEVAVPWIAAVDGADQRLVRDLRRLIAGYSPMGPRRATL